MIKRKQEDEGKLYFLVLRFKVYRVFSIMMWTLFKSMSENIKNIYLQKSEVLNKSSLYFLFTEKELLKLTLVKNHKPNSA